MKVLKSFDNEKILSFNDFLKYQYESMDFVWAGFPRGVVGSLVAAGGTGKSFFALQKALSVAVGYEEVKKGQVLYLPAEDPLLEVGKRVKAISDLYGFTDKQKNDANKNFHVWSLLGQEPDILQTDDKNKSVFEHNIEIALENFQQKNQDEFRLIIFDTLRRFHYTDENDGGCMSKVLSILEKICQRHNVSCLFLHHTSKAASLNNNADAQQASRGSSVLVDNIRYQEFLVPMSKDEAEKLAWHNPENNRAIDIEEDDRHYYVRWGVSKQNYGNPVTDIWFKRGEGGVLRKCQISARNSTKKSTKNLQNFDI